MSHQGGQVQPHKAREIGRDLYHGSLLPIAARVPANVTYSCAASKLRDYSLGVQHPLSSNAAHIISV